MKHHNMAAVLRGTAYVLSLILCGMCPAIGAGVHAADTVGQKELIVNDGEVGAGLFRFEFSSGWVHEGGYPDRFVGGDEHWTTTATSGDVLPSFVFRFAGTKVSLYGHKVPAGGIACVTIDGIDAGTIDFYAPARVEKTLLFASETLTNGEHAVTVQLTNNHNPAAGNTREASVDYAQVLTDRELPVTAVKASVQSLLLEPEMSYRLGWTLLPDYATEQPVVELTSSDESVLTVRADGTVRAMRAGKATVMLSVDGGRCTDTVAVTVREPVGGDLTGMAGSTNRHTRQDTYLERLADWNPDDTSLAAVSWLRDETAVKLDLLTKGKNMTNVRVSVGELTDAYGHRLAAATTAYFVKSTNAHDTGHDIPDVLYTSEAVDIPAGSVASVWISLQTPEDALPGIYNGNVTVTADGGSSLIFSLTLEVIGLTEPDSAADLELWQYPYSSNRYYSGKTTEEYFGSGVEGLWSTHLDPVYEAGLVSQIRLYAQAGGRSITATVVEDPWNSQTPDPYPSMIKWTRGEDRHFTFDYTDFDYWVELNTRNGVDGRILAFSISDWANRITYFDERSGEVCVENLTPGSSRWKAVWGEFLRDFMVHTTEKGWFDRVYMAMDERPADVVENVLDLVESVRNEQGECFRTALAVFTFDTEYLFDRVTDLSLAIYMDPVKLDALTVHRRRLGLTTTLYTCGAQYSALENAPIESLYTLWYCEKRGADGFLRWALDAFNADPLRSSEHVLFAAGDIYLIYPDERSGRMTAKSSPRFEKLAEGCRDVSKLRYLRRLAPGELSEVERQLKRMDGTDMEAQVTRLQKSLQHAARRVALAQWIAEAEKVDEPDNGLETARKAAQSVLEDPDATDGALSEAVAQLACLLDAQSTDQPVIDDGSASADADTTGTEPGKTVGTDTESDGTGTGVVVKVFGCGSSLDGAVIVGTVVTAAAVATGKRRERNE